MRAVIIVIVILFGVIDLARVDWIGIREVSGLDHDSYVRRLNAYPRDKVKLGYYIETYIEPIWFVKLRNQLFGGELK